MDLFFPCLLGEPACEVQDPVEVGKYHSLYTEVLVAGLRGDYVEAVEQTTDAGNDVGLVRPRLLADALPNRVADRAAALQAGLTVNQRPDARITSDSRVAWLSRIVRLPDATALEVGPVVTNPSGVRPPRSQLRGRDGPPGRPPAAQPNTAAEQTANQAASRLISHRLAGGRPPTGLVVRGARIAAAHAEPGVAIDAGEHAVGVGFPDSQRSARIPM
ncbi:hypothetical protein ACIPSA_35635 [Streptomyces sp. NPDC086549]|uniref:hypothetical protein n=1 Tax=Streptomyces sp. NPDC086549 TaxID=3365752 RepID=UPI003814BCA9